MPRVVAAQSSLAAAAKLAEVSSVQALPRPVVGSLQLPALPLSCGVWARTPGWAFGRPGAGEQAE